MLFLPPDPAGNKRPPESFLSCLTPRLQFTIS
jgi:hypothetical protein